MRSRDKHAPNSLENYLILHEKHLQLREHFIVKNELSDTIPYGFGRLRIEGVIYCRGNTFLNVDKTLWFVPDGRVETIRYAYHGGVSYPEDHAIFRFDNAHGGHEQHGLDPATGEERWPPRELERDEMNPSRAKRSTRDRRRPHRHRHHR